MADDERIAELCRQAFAAADAARQADGMTMYALQKRLGKGRRTVSFAQLRTALRGRPSEFLLFNRRGKHSCPTRKPRRQRRGCSAGPATRQSTRSATGRCI